MLQIRFVACFFSLYSLNTFLLYSHYECLFDEKMPNFLKMQTAYNFASVNRLDNSACYVQWKRDTGETFLVLLSGQSRKVDITCGMQKTRKAQTVCKPHDILLALPA